MSKNYKVQKDWKFDVAVNWLIQRYNETVAASLLEVPEPMVTEISLNSQAAAVQILTDVHDAAFVMKQFGYSHSIWYDLYHHDGHHLAAEILGDEQTQPLMITHNGHEVSFSVDEDADNDEIIEQLEAIKRAIAERLQYILGQPPYADDVAVQVWLEDVERAVREIKQELQGNKKQLIIYNCSSCDTTGEHTLEVKPEDLGPGWRAINRFTCKSCGCVTDA